MRSPDLSAIAPYLRAVTDMGGSDLHIRAGQPVQVRVKGALTACSATALSAQEAETIIRTSMPADVLADFESRFDVDYAIAAEGIGRFRVNAFRTRGTDGAVLRLIGDEPIPLTALNVPPVIKQLALAPRGLVLVTGPTGSGKTTTLAGMIDAINEERPVHILTLEDPIEVIHKSKSATITQRELGSDTLTWHNALKGAMRQDPDVILIGEMRDAETVHAALSAAETGHMVFSTLHTTDALETITRIMEFFPPHEQPRVRAALSTSLRGIICQRLVPKADGAGRVCVMEIAVGDARFADAVADPEKTSGIPDILAAGAYAGMQAFDQHLLNLTVERVIDPKVAISTASNAHDFTVKLRRAGWKPDS